MAAAARRPLVIPVIYMNNILYDGRVQRQEYGDFTKMIVDDYYKDSLFIFNDNIDDHKSSIPGGGNAQVRDYNMFGLHENYPQSAGIPTGSKYSTGVYQEDFSGFKTLGRAKKHVDDSIREINYLIKTHNYKRIYFSVGNYRPAMNPETGKGGIDELYSIYFTGGRPALGISLFKPAEEVLKYITNEIYSLGDYAEEIPCLQPKPGIKLPRTDI